MDSPPSALLLRSSHSDRGTVPPRVTVWLAAIAISFLLDKPIAVILHERGVDAVVKFSGWPVHALKLAGFCWYTLIIAIALAIWHPLHLRAAAFECGCCVAAGANSIIKWVAGRTRPFKLSPTSIAQPFRWSWFDGGGRGLFHQSNDLAFVSGHTAVAFATAAGVAVLLPGKRRIIAVVYAIAIALLAERVLENAHWLSDAVCGAALGVWGATLLQWICTRWSRTAIRSLYGNTQSPVFVGRHSLLQRGGKRADAPAAGVGSAGRIA